MLALVLAFALTAAAFAGGPSGGGQGSGKRVSSVQAQAPPPCPLGLSWWHHAVRLVVAVGVVLLVAAAFVLLFEDRFVFRPARKPLVSWDPPGPGVEECTFRTRDGLKLHGWWHGGGGPDDSSPRPVLLWCHGNAGNITHRADNMRMLAQHGLALFLFDYRGYGKSEGTASETGLYLDGEAAYRYLIKERGVDPGRIICFGRSLGAAVALHVATRRKTAGLIMESAFESVPAMAVRKLALPPLAGLLRNRFDNLRRIGRLAVPLLTVHGCQDKLVPIEHGRRIYDAAPEPKQFYPVEGAGHDDAYTVGGDPYYQALCQFCSQCVN